MSEIETGLLEAMRSAARAVVPLLGGGDGDAIDALAVDALRAGLYGLPVDGRVVVGEGEKDQAPMLFVGEGFGSGGMPIDIAVGMPSIATAIARPRSEGSTIRLA